MESDIFVKDNLTDFEKLLFANAYIKELKTELKKANCEIGILQSEISEICDLDKNAKKVHEQRTQLASLNEKLEKTGMIGKRKYDMLNADYIQLKIKYQKLKEECAGN